MGNNLDFFEEQTEQSFTKAKIVSDYYSIWSQIMKRHWPETIAYIDLYCGPGEYKDGNSSVPVLLINTTLKDQELFKRMRFLFNDSDSDNIESLKNKIESMKLDNNLENRIYFMNSEIDSNFYEDLNFPPNVPILSFVDPWGYKGLTLDLISALIKTNGSDCIFFFNYSRINMALSTSQFDEHLKGIFGDEKTAELKKQLKALDAPQREQVVIDALTESLKANGSNYVLPFKFYCQGRRRTSHFIIFVTKHPAGYKIMKEIMYTNSAKDEDGIASFSYEDSENFNNTTTQLSLFPRPMEELCNSLYSTYVGEKVQIGEICNLIMNDTSNKFVSANVKEALRILERKGNLKIEGRKQATRNGVATMPDKAYAVFIG